MSQVQSVDVLSAAQSDFLQQVAQRYVEAHDSIGRFEEAIQSSATKVLERQNSAIHRTFRKRTKFPKVSSLTTSTPIDLVLGGSVRLASIGVSVGLGLIWDRKRTSIPMLYADIACDGAEASEIIRFGLQDATSELMIQSCDRLIWATQPFDLSEFGEIDDKLESLLTCWLALLREAKENQQSTEDDLPLQ
jgi:hypothetical protein